MKKTNYEQGQIPTIGDMNDQHLLTEQALGAFVEAVTGGLATALLSDRTPVVTESGANWHIDVPEQFAAVNGRLFKIGATTLSVPIADKQIGVYFILKETDNNEFRERLRLSGSTPVRETFSPTVRKIETSRVSYTESGGPTLDPPAPSLASDDVGSLSLAIIVSEVGTPNVATVVHNSAIVWNFPGGGLAVGKHAPQHMPGGNDQIPLAQLGGAQGSSSGLMPETYLAIVKESIQDIVISPNSPYLQATDSGSNTLVDPKKATLELKIDNSLEVKDDAGQPRLGIRFSTGPYAGNSGVAPHSNHTHSLSESPIRVDVRRVEITSAAQLGTIINLAPFGVFADIYSIEVVWSPPNYNIPVPGILCNWVKTSTGFVGVRAHKAAANTVVLEIGREGLTEMQDTTKNWVVDQYTQSQTWDSATADGNTPRNGVLFVKVIGI